MAKTMKCEKCGHVQSVSTGITDDIRTWARDYFKANPQASNNDAGEAYMAACRKESKKYSINTVMQQVRNAR